MPTADTLAATDTRLVLMNLTLAYRRLRDRVAELQDDRSNANIEQLRKTKLALIKVSAAIHECEQL